MKFLFAVCVLLLGAVNGKDQMYTDPSSNITVKVLGQSGKFFFGKLADNFQNAEGTIQVTMDSLVEKTTDGKDIRIDKEKVKHRYETFANQAFTIREPKPHIFKSTINTTMIVFDSQLDNRATLKVVMYMIQNDGSYKDADNKMVELKKGMLKWTIEVRKWPFCNNCTVKNDSVGDSLEFTITVKGKSNATKKAGSTMDYNLGGDAVIKLNNKLVVDGKPMTMAAEYPKLEPKGGKDQFIFKFPVFKANCTHDPILALEGGGDMTSTTPQATPPTTINPCTGAASNLPWIAMIFACSALVNMLAV